MVERAVILIDDGASLDVQQLFSGGEIRQARVTTARTKSANSETHNEPDAHSPLDALLADGPSLEQLEADIILRTLEISRGNVSAAARKLGMQRGQLAYRLKKYE